MTLLCDQCTNQLSRPLRSGDGNQGFTLLEMLVVLVIVSLVTVLSFPYFVQRNQSAPSQRFTSKLEMMLRQARVLALTSNKSVSVFYDQDNLLFSSPDKNMKLAVPAKVSVVLLAVARTGVSRQVQFKFFADGTATGGKIDIIFGLRKRRINIHWLTGSISRENQVVENVEP